MKEQMGIVYTCMCVCRCGYMGVHVGVWEEEGGHGFARWAGARLKSLWAKRSLENFRASKQVRVGWNEIIKTGIPKAPCRYRRGSAGGTLAGEEVAVGA